LQLRRLTLKVEDFETLVAIRNVLGEETFRFLEIDKYSIKLVSLKNPRQFIALSWFDVPYFLEAIKELEALNRF
jgi:hypothetical protein